MRPLERGVLHAGGDEKRQAGQDAQENDDDEEPVTRAHRCQLDGPLEEEANRDSQEDERYARGDLPRQHAPVIVVATDVGGRAGGDGRSGLGRAGSEVARHEAVERTVEDLTDLEELVHLRLALFP